MLDVGCYEIDVVEAVLACSPVFAWGASGRWFESSHPDLTKTENLQ